jgi:hypothetical protein
MLAKKKILISLTFAVVLVFTFAVPAANAKGNEYDAVCDHLESKYKAKKVKIPFMWLARAVVGVVRPAGVKSFKITQFRNLQFSRESLDKEMQAVMTNAFSDDWSPILRVRSRNGEQVYMNMRETGNSVKILLVSIEKDEATVIRARFNPDKLVAFMENPKIFGISLDDNNSEAKNEAPDSEDEKIKSEQLEVPKETN